jgi:hypothetical protein
MKSSLVISGSIIVLALVGFLYLNYIKTTHEQEMSVECSTAAKSWHDQQVQTMATIKYQISPDYFDHYNTQDGNCYATMTEDWNNTTTGIAYSNFLYNIYENTIVLEDDTVLGQINDLYQEYSSDEASSTQITADEYNTLFKSLMSN